MAVSLLPRDQLQKLFDIDLTVNHELDIEGMKTQLPSVYWAIESYIDVKSLTTSKKPPIIRQRLFHQHTPFSDIVVTRPMEGEGLRLEYLQLIPDNPGNYLANSCFLSQYIECLKQVLINIISHLSVEKAPYLSCSLLNSHLAVLFYDFGFVFDESDNDQLKQVISTYNMKYSA